MKAITALWIAITAALLPGVYTQGRSSATAKADARGVKSTTGDTFKVRGTFSRPANWTRRVNQPVSKKEKEAITRSINRGVPYGSEQWTASTVKRLGLESTTRPRGRPKKFA